MTRWGRHPTPNRRLDQGGAQAGRDQRELRRVLEAVCGSSSRAHLEENAGAANLPLSPDDRAQLTPTG